MSNQKNNSINVLERKKDQSQYAEFCKECGGKIIHIHKRTNKIFCSDECRQKWWNANLDKVKRKAYYDKVCFRCGKPFTIYGIRGAKFCSKSCFEAWRSNKKNER